MSEKSEEKFEMKEEINHEENSHHDKDEAELNRLETNLDETDSLENDSSASKPKSLRSVRQLRNFMSRAQSN